MVAVKCYSRQRRTIGETECQENVALLAPVPLIPLQSSAWDKFQRDAMNGLIVLATQKIALFRTLAWRKM